MIFLKINERYINFRFIVFHNFRRKNEKTMIEAHVCSLSWLHNERAFNVCCDIKQTNQIVITQHIPAESMLCFVFAPRGT